MDGPALIHTVGQRKVKFMEIPEEINPRLKALLKDNPEAWEYFESLHPSVRARIEFDDIDSDEALAERANEAMRAAMMDYSGIYDDSDSWPNGPAEP
jgi:hypothetical protein